MAGSRSKQKIGKNPLTWHKASWCAVGEMNGSHLDDHCQCVATRNQQNSPSHSNSSMLFCVAGGINFVLGPMTNKSSGVTHPGKHFLLICQKNKRNASTNRSSLKNQECKNKLIHRCLSTMLQACAFLQCCFSCFFDAQLWRSSTPLEHLLFALVVEASSMDHALHQACCCMGAH